MSELITLLDSVLFFRRRLIYINLRNSSNGNDYEKQTKLNNYRTRLDGTMEHLEKGKTSNGVTFCRQRTTGIGMD